MAGITSSLSFEDNQTTQHSEGLEFAFDIEGNHSNIVNTSTTTFYSVLSENIEFTDAGNTHYWRFLAMVFVLGTIFSMGLFSLNDHREALTASLLKADTPTRAIQKVSVLPKTDLATITLVSEKEREALAELKIMPLANPVEELKELEPIKETTLAIVPEISETKELSPKLNTKPTKVQNYKTNSLAKAKSLSAQTGRYTFIKFGADWCMPCRMMENTALKHEKVVDLLDKKFVILEVDVDKGNGAKLKEEYYVDQLPTIIILDELGNQMERRDGGLGTIGMIEMLESVAQYIYLEEEAITVSNYDAGNIQGR